MAVWVGQRVCGALKWVTVCVHFATNTLGRPCGGAGGVTEYTGASHGIDGLAQPLQQPPGEAAPASPPPPATDGNLLANDYCGMAGTGASACTLTLGSDAMNMSTLKALTWGTVAAAVLSALMLASGELDNEHDAGGKPAVGMLLPADTGSGSDWNPTDTGSRDTGQRLPSGQR